MLKRLLSSLAVVVMLVSLMGALAPVPDTSVVAQSIHSDVSGCGVISSAGSYSLTKNIASGDTVCIAITASSVVLDGNGYTINGQGVALGAGPEAVRHAVHVHHASATLTNVTVKNLTLTHWDDGIKFDQVNNGGLENISASYCDSGIYLYDSDNNSIEDSDIGGNNTFGITLVNADYNTLSNSTLDSNTYALNLAGANYNDIFSNTVTSNFSAFHFQSSVSDNTIYNNYLRNNKDIVVSTEYNNLFNTAETPGTNFVGGASMGGNYWADPTGSGFSETCTDSDFDGFCDDAYDVVAGASCTAGVDCGLNVDYLPLTTDDSDLDGVLDSLDNCPIISNTLQLDDDGDNVGNVCDNCPDVENPSQSDSEPAGGDGYGDACDNCWSVTNEQIDSDGNCPAMPFASDPACGDACQDSDGDGVPDGSDNCDSEPNPLQENHDGDALGDACDNCWLANNLNQNDRDGDCVTVLQQDPEYWDNALGIWVANPWCGDACDGCPDHADSAWEDDWDSDYVGNACDCDDGYKGPNENGADCGFIGNLGHVRDGACAPLCNPHYAALIQNGNSDDLIDIVFIPHIDYLSTSSMADFEPFVWDTILEYFLRLDEFAVDPLPSGYEDLFNFYIYTGNYMATGGGCTAQLPHNFRSDVSFADVSAIIGLSAGGCAQHFVPPSVLYSTDIPNVVVHEAGHALFGLIDEYCGCTYYPQWWGYSPVYPNLWTSEGGCEADRDAEGWTLGSCTELVCQRDCDEPRDGDQETQISDYWAYDPNHQTSPLVADYMTACNSAVGGCGGDYMFFEADVRQMNYVFDQWLPGGTKGVLVEFNINNGTLTVLDSQVVESHPNLGLQSGPFLGEVLSATGDDLQSFQIWDPRLREDGVPRDNIDFAIIFPFHDNVKTFEIHDIAEDEKLVSVDLTAPLFNHCRGVDYGGHECQSLDLDNDGFQDHIDNCPLTYNPDQSDADKNGVGDVCEPVAYLPLILRNANGGEQ